MNGENMGFHLAAEGGRQPLAGPLRFDTAHRDDGFGFEPGSDLFVPADVRVEVDFAVEFDERFEDPANRSASLSIEVDGEARYPTPFDFTARDSGIFGGYKIGAVEKGQALRVVLSVDGEPEASRVRLTVEGND